ncbi:MAG: metallophosphoesterase [Candidatus Pacearchaeota archaeon]
MKLLIIGDLHGRKPIIKTKDFDAFALVGDICDDRKIGKLYKKYFTLLKNPDFEMGFKEFAYSEIEKNKFLEYEKKSLIVGRKILKYLDKFEKPIFMVGGNWDQSYGKTMIKNVDKDTYNRLRYFYDSWMGDKLNSFLTKGIRNLKNCMFRNVEYNGINFVGYGLSSGPERVKKKYKKEMGSAKFNILKNLRKKLFGKLYSIYKNRKNKRIPTVFISHNIPYGTRLDIIKDKKSYAYKKHAGSILARDFCKKFQPLVCIGGHVHEGKGKDKIGKTTIINPGYGANAQVLLELEENKKAVRKIKFLSHPNI